MLHILKLRIFFPSIQKNGEKYVAIKYIFLCPDFNFIFVNIGLGAIRAKEPPYRDGKKNCKQNYSLNILCQNIILSFVLKY